MSDIVEWLREPDLSYDKEIRAKMKEAADEIERLRAELAHAADHTKCWEEATRLAREIERLKRA